MKTLGESTVQAMPLSRTNASVCPLARMNGTGLSGVAPEGGDEHEPPYAGRRGGLDEVAVSVAINGLDGVLASPSGGVRRGDDGVDAGAGGVQRPAVLEVTADDVGVPNGGRAFPDRHPKLVSLLLQPAGDEATRPDLTPNTPPPKAAAAWGAQLLEPRDIRGADRGEQRVQLRGQRLPLECRQRIPGVGVGERGGQVAPGGAGLSDQEQVCLAARVAVERVPGELDVEQREGVGVPVAA